MEEELHLKVCDKVFIICNPLTTVHSTCIFLVSVSFIHVKKNERKWKKRKSRLFSTLSVLVPGNCSVDGYGDEDLINFFLSSSRISSFKK